MWDPDHPWLILHIYILLNISTNRSPLVHLINTINLWCIQLAISSHNMQGSLVYWERKTNNRYWQAIDWLTCYFPCMVWGIYVFNNFLSAQNDATDEGRSNHAQEDESGFHLRQRSAFLGFPAPLLRKKPRHQAISEYKLNQSTGSKTTILLALFLIFLLDPPHLYSLIQINPIIQTASPISHTYTGKWTVSIQGEMLETTL